MIPKLIARFLGIAFAAFLILGFRAYQVERVSADIDSQLLGQASVWPNEPSGPLQQGEMTVCAGSECTNITARSGDQILIGGRGNIAEITVNGVPVHAKRRGYDIVITAP